MVRARWRVVIWLYAIVYLPPRHRAGGKQPLMSRSLIVEIVQIFEIAITEFENRDIRGGARRQRAATAKHRENVFAAFIVARAITWSSGMPSIRNLDMQFGKSITPVICAFVFQSVEKVSGQKFCLHHLIDGVPAHVTGLTIANIEPYATAPRCDDFRKILPLSSIMLLGGGAYIWVTTSPGLSSSISFGSGVIVCPMWIMTGRLKEEATCWVRRSTS